MLDIFGLLFAFFLDGRRLLFHSERGEGMEWDGPPSHAVDAESFKTRLEKDLRLTSY